jgi:Zn-dependent protease with chaperone function
MGIMWLIDRVVRATAPRKLIDVRPGAVARVWVPQRAALRVGRWPQILGSATNRGVSLARTVVIAPHAAERLTDTELEGVIRHELIHMLQWERHGAIRFLWRYWRMHRRHGYRGNPFEIEARIRAGQQPPFVTGRGYPEP